MQKREEIIKYVDRTIKLLSQKTEIKYTRRKMNRDSKICGITKF